MQLLDKVPVVNIKPTLYQYQHYVFKNQCCQNKNLCPHELSHETVFYSTKKEWTYHRNYDHFNAVNEDQLIKSKPEGYYLPKARNIFLPFAALDGKRTVIFQNSAPMKPSKKRSSISRGEITQRKVRNKKFERRQRSAEMRKMVCSAL